MIHFQKLTLFKSSFWIIALLLLSFMSLIVMKIQPIPILTPLIQNNSSSETRSTPSSAYTLVDPIQISNDSDWANNPFITGVGTPGDPYIIEGIEIAGNNSYYEGDIENAGIRISNSNACVIIRDCFIHHCPVGIFFGIWNETFPHRCENNVIENCGFGIYSFAANITISNNHIAECHAMETNLFKFIYSLDPEYLPSGGVGIYAFQSHLVNITSNIITNCDVGTACRSRAILSHNQFIGCGFLISRAMKYSSNLTNNSVNGLPLGYFTPFNYNQTEGEPLILDGKIQQYGQLLIFGLENVEIKNMNIRDTTIGYDIEATQNLTITDCTADNCLFGMYIYDLAPANKTIAEYIDIKGIHILNCIIGFQFVASKSNVDRVNYNVTIDIAEFSLNQIDIFMALLPSNWDLLTVPVNTSVYLDYYQSYRLQVSYNNSLLNATDSQLENLPSFIIPEEYELNATIVHLNHLGQYHILLEILESDEWVALWNATINVVEVPTEKKSIGAYTGLWLSSTFGMSLVCIMIFVKKRKVTFPEI